MPLRRRPVQPATILREATAATTTTTRIRLAVAAAQAAAHLAVAAIHLAVAVVHSAVGLLAGLARLVVALRRLAAVLHHLEVAAVGVADVDAFALLQPLRIADGWAAANATDRARLRKRIERRKALQWN